MKQRTVAKGDGIRQEIRAGLRHVYQLAVHGPGHGDPVAHLQGGNAFAHLLHDAGGAVPQHSGKGNGVAPGTDVGVAGEIGPLRAAADGGTQQAHLHLPGRRRLNVLFQNFSRVGSGEYDLFGLHWIYRLPDFFELTLLYRGLTAENNSV